MTDTTAAHVYRDGKIIFTILVEQGEDGWYTAYPVGRPTVHLAQRKSRAEVLDQMELYLDGYSAGYDDGVDHARENYTGYYGTNAKKREANRNQRRRRRIASP